MKYLLLLILFIQACSTGSENSIDISEVWIREVPVNSDITALYFEVKNGGSSDDIIVSVNTHLSEKAEIHNTVINSGGSAKMERLEEVVVPSRDTVSFSPGGMHVMLIGLNKNIKTGEEYQVNINFKNSGNKIVKARVRGIEETINSHKNH